MKTLACVLSLAALLSFPFLAAAQETEIPTDLVPRWTHGPTVAFYAVSQDAEGTYHGNMLTSGAGWEIAMSLVDSNYFPWVAIGMPHVIGSETAGDSFKYSTGLTLKIAGNIGFGALVDLVQTDNGDGSGLFTGDFSWKKNGTLVFMVSAPFTSNGAVYTVGK